MEKIDGVEKKGVSLDERAPRKNDLDAIVSEIKEDKFKGLVCAFDLSGKILFGNEKTKLFIKSESFFDIIPARERSNLVEMFYQIFQKKKAGDKIPCFMPITVGRFQVDHKKVRAELMPFARGFVLKIPEEVLEGITEMEVEKLKILLMEYPMSGLWIADERGMIVDVLKENLADNLGWREEDLIGKNISSVVQKMPEPNREVYVIDRVHADGSHVRAEVVEGKVIFSDGNIYHLYIDTYFR
jgi:hypothetical protein